MTYTILILGGFDILFNVLFFRVGILFILTLRYMASSDITHSLSVVPGRPHLHIAVLANTRPFSPTPDRPSSSLAVFTHTRPFSPTLGRFHPHSTPSLPIPGRHQLSPPVIPCSPPSPAAPLIFVDTFPDIIPITCSVCPIPAVLTFTLPSSDTPYSPPHNSGRPPISRPSG